MFVHSLNRTTFEIPNQTKVTFGPSSNLDETPVMLTSASNVERSYQLNPISVALKRVGLLKHLSHAKHIETVGRIMPQARALVESVKPVLSYSTLTAVIGLASEGVEHNTNFELNGDLGSKGMRGLARRAIKQGQALATFTNVAGQLTKASGTLSVASAGSAPINGMNWIAKAEQESLAESLSSKLKMNYPTEEAFLTDAYQALFAWDEKEQDLVLQEGIAETLKERVSHELFSNLVASGKQILSEQELSDEELTKAKQFIEEAQEKLAPSILRKVLLHGSGIAGAYGSGAAILRLARMNLDHMGAKIKHLAILSVGLSVTLASGFVLGKVGQQF